MPNFFLSFQEAEQITNFLFDLNKDADVEADGTFRTQQLSAFSKEKG